VIVVVGRLRYEAHHRVAVGRQDCFFTLEHRSACWRGSRTGLAMAAAAKMVSESEKYIFVESCWHSQDGEVSILIEKPW
jgi:hypothetical protein